MIALPAEITFATAPRVLDDAARTVDDALRGAAAGTALDIDLGGCDRFDSSLLSVLLELARHAAAAGATCRLHHVPSNLGKLAALYGADDLLFAPR